MATDKAFEGRRVTVVIKHPDYESCEASRIIEARVFDGDVPALDLDSTQEAFTAEIEASP